MKVKELIKELKKVNPDLEIDARYNNREYCIELYVIPDPSTPDESSKTQNRSHCDGFSIGRTFYERPFEGSRFHLG
jgi:hypothetical protein